MQSWLKVSILLCVFGMAKEFRPSEPYVTKYLNNPPMNFTKDEIGNQIYPIGTYATMISLVFVFLFTDYLRYKSVIILDILSAIITFVMLITVRTLFLVQVLEVFYGFFMAAEVAYYTYIYAKVDKSHFQEVSGFTRAAYLTGRGISGIISQGLVSFDISYYFLNFLTLAGCTFALIVACFLPPISTSFYKESNRALNESRSITGTEASNLYTSSNSLFTNVRYLLRGFYTSYSNTYVIKWAFWWALATCGYYQTLVYVTVLWEEIEDAKYNGAVETAYTLTSALASLGCSKLIVDWTYYGESVLCLCSIGISVSLFFMSHTTNIFIAYGLYVSYAVIYNGMITIANSEIAKHVNSDSQGLVYGFNYFLALVLQSILTAIVNSSLRFGERMKFVIYSGYFGVLGLVFGFMVILKLCRSNSSKSEST